ncbi:MAG: hypothetical protein QF724_08590 [Planctomycetota bacterium]|jgi:hypothetical protein|nr:hypothetical protein [Planctomycetota bacterium]MDP6370839.1 hypothetical protein [Planctomycetota bacterium]MDP6519698.1 hypothetical protein [Planctomycetota bacterium]MDP6838979.1 hypothetical protein [Planctomycetota bacterium]MDP6956688.1 hypothetical protein [Planctomycetota bacterium]
MKITNLRALFTISLITALSACSAVPWIEAEEGVESVPPAEEPGEWTASMEGEGPLYGWDGSVVAGEGEGSVSPAPAPLRRETAGAQGSRMYILELYQETVDERDSLRIEIESLEEALARAQALYDDLWTSHEDLKAVQIALRGERDSQRAENFDLAARLTTAQIRRLEAEKLLIETRLNWEQALSDARDTAVTTESGEQR